MDERIYYSVADTSYDDLLKQNHKLEMKMELIRNALEAKVPHQYILSMLDGADRNNYIHVDVRPVGPFYGQMEEDEDAT